MTVGSLREAPTEGMLIEMKIITCRATHQTKYRQEHQTKADQLWSRIIGNQESQGLIKSANC